MEIRLRWPLDALIDRGRSDVGSSVGRISQFIARGDALDGRGRLRDSGEVLNVAQGFARTAHAEHAGRLRHCDCAVRDSYAVRMIAHDELKAQEMGAQVVERAETTLKTVALRPHHHGDRSLTKI